MLQLTSVTNCACEFKNKAIINYSYVINGTKLNDGMYSTNTTKTCILGDCPCLFKNQANINYSYSINGTKLNNGISQSNMVRTCIISKISSVSGVKYSYSLDAKVGDILDFSVIVENTGETPLNKLKMVDILDPSMEYVANSAIAFINSLPSAITDNSTQSNIELTLNKVLNINETAIFMFKLKVKSNAVVGSVIKNKVQLKSDEITTPTDTNETLVNIQYAKLVIEKTVDKSSVECDGSLSYNFTIRNAGNIEVTNVVFKDYFESKFRFEESGITSPAGSTINLDTDYNGVSIIIPKIDANSSVLITISGTVRCC